MLPSLLPSFWPGIGEPNVIKAMSGKCVLTETFRRAMQSHAVSRKITGDINDLKILA